MSNILIGEKLTKLRGSRTQAEVANAIGTSVAAVGMYERGERIPRDEIKVKIARYYNQSIESIFFTD